MKKQVTILGFALFIFAAVAISTFAQNGKENKGKGNNKEVQGNKNNNQNGEKGDKVNKGKNGDNPNKGSQANENKGKGKSEKGNNNNGKGNGDGKGRDTNDNDERGQGKHKMKDGFKWDDQTFRDRDKIRKGMEKVTICHKFRSGDEPAVTIRVSEAALKAHMNHGDVTGECPANTGNFSDDYLRRRTNFFEVLQNGQEQVIYSRSILDYAIERLTGARTQLVTLQQSNAPAADVERKRLLIVDLEQNVSVLQTLVGVTANLIADKLVN